MAATFVQSKSVVQNGGSNSVALTFTNPVTSGNTLVAVLGYHNLISNLGSGSITDSTAGGGTPNVYTQIQDMTWQGADFGGADSENTAWFVKNAAAGSTTITYTNTHGSNAKLWFTIAEFSGLGAA